MIAKGAKNGFIFICFISAILLAGCSQPEDNHDMTTGELAQHSDKEKGISDIKNDVTVQVRESAGELSSLILVANETEPGRVVIETTVVDPKGGSEGNGSPEAIQAIEICEATVTLGYENVSVMENDGTTFVLYNHPLVPAGKCGEV